MKNIMQNTPKINKAHESIDLIPEYNIISAYYIKHDGNLQFPC